jgi:hypothetical protein
MPDEAVLDPQVTPDSSSAPDLSSSAGVSDSLPSGGGEETAHLEGGGSGEQAQPSFLEQLGEFGDDFKGVTDESAARTMLLERAREWRQQQQELQAWQQQAAPYVHYGQQYAQQARDPEYQAWLAARQAKAQQPTAQPAQAAEKPTDKWWNPPTFDRNTLARYVERVVNPETGEIEARLKHDTPLEVRSAYENHQSYLADWQDRIATRPHEVIPEIIKQEVGPLVQQILEQRDREQQTRMFAQNVNSQNKSWLYQLDPQGNPLVDPVQGTPLFSEAGAKVRDYMSWFEQQGMRDPQARWFAATTMLMNEAQGQVLQQHEQQFTAAQVAAQKKAAVVQGNGANHIPNRGGSQPRPQSSRPVPQNRRLRAGDRLANLMTANGLDSVPTGELFNSRS